MRCSRCVCHHPGSFQSIRWHPTPGTFHSIFLHLFQRDFDIFVQRNASPHLIGHWRKSNHFACEPGPSTTTQVCSWVPLGDEEAFWDGSGASEGGRRRPGAAAGQLKQGMPTCPLLPGSARGSPAGQLILANPPAAEPNWVVCRRL